MTICRPIFLPLLLLAPWAWAATPITTVPLADLLVRPEHSAPARIIARDTPALSAEITARIEGITVRVGDEVRQGDTLVTLDCRLYHSRLAAAEAQLQQLQARLGFARRQLQRAEDLKQKKSFSDEGVEQRQSELDGLFAQRSAQRELVRQAQLQVEHCSIRAPVNGVVVERLASTGELATPGTPVLSLVQLDELEISARLGEAEAESLQHTRNHWFEYQGTRHPVQLRSLLSVVDTQSRTREARFRLSGATLPAGAAGRAIWENDQPFLPADYLVRRGEHLGIFHLEAGKARFHPLPEALEGQPAAIDLKPQTPIIVEGRYGLREGDRVATDGTPTGDAVTD